MIPSILIDDHLSRARLARVFFEAKCIESPSCSLLINSDTGDGVAAVEFVENMRGLGLKYQIKIYKASSTAAFIALALGDYIEMKEDSFLGIHRGEIRLSPSEISPDNKVNEDLAKSFRKYDKALTQTLKARGLRDHLYVLFASDWVRFSAAECFRLRIVQRLF